MFGGVPQQILELVINKRIRSVTSPILLSELSDILRKKFKFSTKMSKKVDQQIRKITHIVEPDIQVSVCRDGADNRVLEAAQGGKCEYVVTGDKDLLILGNWRGIQIVTPKEFMSKYLKNI